MPLHRVTFSGRFSQFESEVKEPVYWTVLKGIGAMAVDIVIALAVAIFAYRMFTGKLVSPYERGFYCYEVPDLSNPFYPNTISSRHLLLLSLASPFLIILLVEAIIFLTSSGSNRLRKYFFSATSLYLEYLAAFTVAVFSMEALKCAFARLRPHYLSVCKPNWTLINCTDPNTYIGTAHCTGTDMHRIRIGRQSFPSGHTAAAVMFFTFCYFYLRAVLNATGNVLLRYLRIMLLSAIGVWTVVVMVTRITDYWHHPSDVLGGIMLGLSCIYIPIRRMRSSTVFKQRLLDGSYNS